MFPYLKSLLMDEGRFIGALRALLAVVGMGIQGGYAPDFLPAWVGMLGVGGALFMRSSAGKPKPPAGKPKPPENQAQS